MQPAHVFPATLFVIGCLVNFVIFFLCRLPRINVTWWPWLNQTKFGRWLGKAHLPLGAFLIKLLCDCMREQYARNWVKDTARALSEENIATLSGDEQDDLVELVGRALSPTEHSMGRRIAWVEEVLYMYSAFAQIESIFSGVLLFKAFYAWISSDKVQILRPPVPATYSDNVKNQFARFCNSRSPMLVKFYEYAIGNFISLAIALLCYLLVTKFSYHCSQITNWTTYPQLWSSGLKCMWDPGRGI